MRYLLSSLLLLLVLSCSESKGRLVARINNLPIWESELEKAIQENIITDPQETSQNPKLKPILALQTIIKEVLLREEAVRQGVKVSSEEIEKSLDIMVRQIGGKANLATHFKIRHLDKKSLERYMMSELLLNKLVDQAGTVEPTLPELKEVYERYPDFFTIPQTVEIQQFIINNKGESQDFRSLKKKALKLKREAERYTHKFASFAQQNSDEKAGMYSGGKVEVTPGLFVYNFQQAVFKAKEGEILGPIETGLGLHIVKIIKKRPANLLEFDKVRESIRNKLLTENMTKRRMAYLENLFKISRIEIKLPFNQLTASTVTP